jgi:hypothetical protein
MNAFCHRFFCWFFVVRYTHTPPYHAFGTTARCLCTYRRTHILERSVKFGRVERNDETRFAKGVRTLDGRIRFSIHAVAQTTHDVIFDRIHVKSDPSIDHNGRRRSLAVCTSRRCRTAGAARRHRWAAAATAFADDFRGCLAWFHRPNEFAKKWENGDGFNRTEWFGSAVVQQKNPWRLFSPMHGSGVAVIGPAWLDPETRLKFWRRRRFTPEIFWFKSD